jgi:hypothetical protein
MEDYQLRSPPISPPANVGPAAGAGIVTRQLRDFSAAGVHVTATDKDASLKARRNGVRIQQRDAEPMTRATARAGQVACKTEASARDWRNIGLTLLPELERDWKWIDVELLPPSCLITGPM